MHQPSPLPSTDRGGIKQLCRCDATTLCTDCTKLINLGRELCRQRKYLATKLLAYIYLAHRKIELARCRDVGHPLCLRDSLQDLDHITDGTQALSGVTHTGWPIWEFRVIKSRRYD